MTTFIIAEAGVNHNGSVELAVKLVQAAAAAGADAVKFQTFRADRVVSRFAPKAGYQEAATGTGESQLEMVRRLELDAAAHEQLMACCREHGIQFLSTPFDLESVELLVRLGVPRLKISSGEITNAPLLLKAAGTGLPVILSTGMSTLGEVETALGVLACGYLGGEESPSRAGFARAFGRPEGQRALREKVVLLHCTTEYPAAWEEVNLRAMDTLAAAFGLPAGYSDHTPGITVALAAAARGAAVLEKHFTLDKSLPGPDHRASLDPAELAALVQGVRQVETALGQAGKYPTPSEWPNREVVRRSLMAACPIRRGEVFTEANLSAKRPGGGVSPLYFWDWLGRRAEKDYQTDEAIMEA
jgi:N-acetylneuraminate synthase